MRNRIILNQRVEQLLILDPPRVPHIRTPCKTPDLIEHQLFQSLKYRLDPDVLDNAYIRKKTAHLAAKVHGIQQTQYAIKNHQFSEQSKGLLDRISQALILKQEHSIERTYKHHKMHQQDKKLLDHGIRIRVQKNTPDYDIELMDLKTGFKPIQEAAKKSRNMELRLKQRNSVIFRKKYQSHWESSRLSRLSNKNSDTIMTSVNQTLQQVKECDY